MPRVQSRGRSPIIYAQSSKPTAVERLIDFVADDTGGLEHAMPWASILILCLIVLMLGVQIGRGL